ncbi:RagB/SusD family nutrient uptake outer membrane protein [Longitalea arenae]|uniref:RagB/SusD family nutrient uptake outer membrane protein n=1 Tax=Longitalea arenae TaxID=2812558 RepID=UPI00196773E3|nr:RagB/SusD family nutrient uptake outer membrane protein [Longitalea arenae]
MNNKRLLYTAILLASLANAACKKDFLDQSPYGSTIVESEFYTTFDQCNNATKVAYRYVDWDAWWQTQNWRFLAGEAASDNAWIGNTYQSTHASWDAVAHYTIDAGNDRAEGHWIMLYKAIGIWNAAIQGIAKSPIDDNSKNQFIAELKFLRAFNYFDLVRNWGGVPIVTDILPPTTHVGRSSAKEVYDFIINDLKESAAVLPRRSQYPVADRFRASKGAALALLAKTYLYAEDWANAEASAKQVIDLGDYNLETTFGALWNYNYKNGIESIFEIQNASSQQPALPANGYVIPMNSVADGGWGYISVTSDLEKAFIAEGDSTRLHWTINRHGLPVIGDPNTPKFDARPYTGSGTASSKSGRFSRKRYVPRAQRPANGLYALNDIIIRFADVLLIHAEAAAMQHRTAEALSSIKRIRDRVSLPTDMSLNGWNLINAVRKERRLELALEGDRLYDLRRWKDQSGAPVINSIFGPNGSFVKYNTALSTDYWEVNNKTEPQNKGFHFNPAIHLVWPIPNSQVVAAEGAVEQNPGYF